MLRAIAFLEWAAIAWAALNATEDSARITITNERLLASLDKSIGAIDRLTLEGQDLLGARSGNTGIGPYLDCYCIPSGAYTPGRIDPVYTLLQGTDASKTAWTGVVMSETYPATGQVLEQYWFLRDGETGLHTFSRLAYHNSTTPFLRNLQEFRTLFRPNAKLWTNLSTNAIQYAPLPNPNPAAGGKGDFVTVQDATWYLPNHSDPYVIQESDYFTKYTFSDIWRDHRVHGLFADGSTSPDGSTYGAWVVMNSVDTYFGGPKNSDLVVDGILYNYIVSNHHGNGTPNITDGFDRTFGPAYHHFNKGPAGTTLEESREDALQYASPEWNVEFYDSIAEYVPNYVPTSGRGTWSASIRLPQGAKKPIAVLAQNKVDFQDNVIDTDAYQYWADVDPSSGAVQIPRVKAGTYRLTVYAEGIFGQFTQDNIVVKAGKTASTKVQWKGESAGTELFRIGTPDRSSGEFRHGYERDPNHPFHPEEYRIYWAAYDYPTDFPEGVHFKVGESDVAKDLNYVHWSVFGGYANSVRPEPYYGNGDVNNWTIFFDTTKRDLQRKTKATFTVQLAGAKTAAGNTDTYNATEPYSNLPYTVIVNGHALEPWIIPYYHSSSCAVRSSVSCYNIAHKFVFDAKLLKAGENSLVLSLPFNATNHESALLPRSVYVQYDAMRLELS